MSERRMMRNSSNKLVVASTAMAAALVIGLVVRPVEAAKPTAPQRPVISAAEMAMIHAAALELQDRADERSEPLAEGEVEVLEAVVMKAEGRSQWRATENDAWREAKVSDVLKPGAQIRTGRRSTLALRVGHNASMLVDRNSRLTLPQIMKTGSTLKTAVELRRGRADFKVDEVGLTNDFAVVTPSATLAVRGTAKRVNQTARGTEVRGAPTNVMRAIEMRFFMAAFIYYLSGGGEATSAHPNQVLASLLKSFSPGGKLSSMLEEAVESIANETGKTPVNDQREVDVTMQDTDETLMEADEFEDRLQEMMMMDDDIDDDVDDMDDFIPPDFGDISMGGAYVAEFICDYLFTSYGGKYGVLGLDEAYEFRLSEAGLRLGDLDGLIEELHYEICDPAYEDGFTDQTLNEIINHVVAYCDATHEDSHDFAECVSLFGQAVADVFQQNYND